MWTRDTCELFSAVCVVSITQVLGMWILLENTCNTCIQRIQCMYVYTTHYRQVECVVFIPEYKSYPQYSINVVINQKCVDEL